MANDFITMTKLRTIIHLYEDRISVQRYRMINKPSMRMEHKAGDKMFVDYTGDKLWIYPAGELPHQVEVFVVILGCSLLTYVEAPKKILYPPVRMPSTFTEVFLKPSYPIA